MNLLNQLDELKNRLAVELDINKKIRLDQVRLEERLEFEVGKNVTLEAKIRMLEETLTTKEERIKVLTAGPHRIKISCDEDDTVRQRQTELLELTQQRQPSANIPNTQHGVKRGQTSSDESITKVPRVNLTHEGTLRLEQPLIDETLSLVETLTKSPQQESSSSRILSFRSKLLHEMKFNIWSNPRNGIAIVTAEEVILTSSPDTHDGDINGESVIINTNSGIIRPLPSTSNSSWSNDIMIESMLDSWTIPVSSAKFCRGFITTFDDGTIHKFEDDKALQSVRPSFKSNTLIKVIGDQILATTYDGVLILNDKLETVKRFSTVGSSVEQEAECIDGSVSFIAVGFTDGQVCFFARNGDGKPNVYKHNGYIHSVAISDSLLASASEDKHVHVWDMHAKKELYRLKHNGTVGCVTFHNDLIISASYDTTTRIWSKGTGAQLYSLAHASLCWNLDISPNGTLIAIGHGKGVSVWSLANYDKVAELALNDVSDVRFQTNAKIIAGLHNGHVHMIYLND